MLYIEFFVNEEYYELAENVPKYVYLFYIKYR